MHHLLLITWRSGCCCWFLQVPRQQLKYKEIKKSDDETNTNAM